MAVLRHCIPGLQHQYFQACYRVSLRGMCSKTDSRVDWSKAVANAEKIVGYPASYLSLRSLLSDEISNVAFNMRKLVHTNHPLLKTAKRLIYGSKNGLQTRALLLLLVAKSWGVSESVGGAETCEGILSSQRQLAEITEIIHTASLIHRGIVDIPLAAADNGGEQKLVGQKNDLEFGNKMSVLSGDYLLANASVSLAKLGDAKVVEMVSNAISDITQAEFVIDHDSMGNRCPMKGISIDHWKQLTFLSSGSLLANSCKSALKLAGYSVASEEMQCVEEFGKNLMFAYQLHTDLQPYVGNVSSEDACLVAAPVIAHLQREDAAASALRELLRIDVDRDGNAADERSDIIELRAAVHKAVREDSESIEVCRQMCEEYSGATVVALQHFPDGHAKSALHNFVSVMSNV